MSRGPTTWLPTLGCVVATIVVLAGCARPVAPTRIVLIGGAPSEGAGRHAYPEGVRMLKALLESSPDVVARRGLVVDAYPEGWPMNPSAFDGAATVVWYFDGLDRHPLRDPRRRAQVAALVRRGVGVVALHQATTVPPGDDLGVLDAVGGVREGLFDRTTETARLESATPTHPVTRGLGVFDHRDEFYPTLRFATRGHVTPIVDGVLHVQFRDGRSLVEETAERRVVAWAYERDDAMRGGRAFAFTGAHFIEALDRREVRTMLLNAIFWTAGLDVPAGGVATTLAVHDPIRRPLTVARPDRSVTTFHRDAARSGWYDAETVLGPDVVRSPTFGAVWESPPFAAVDGQAARLYATPLYVDAVTMTAGPYRGSTFATVLAATSNGDVYAVNARQQGDIAPGRILWHTKLAEPCKLQPAPLDGVPTGILSTPVIDLARGRLYVTHCDPARGWQAHALDLADGRVVDGWPVRLDEETFNAVNANAGPERVAPTRRFDFRVQRGALALSPDGAHLYVTFGETETGWLVAVDTRTPKVASAFATVAMPRKGSGGLWGAGGASVDAQGRVFVVTGTGYDGFADRPHDWTQSLLMLSPPARAGFALRGTWTPFNHCLTALNDIDLGSGGVALLPAQGDDRPLLAVGGKQGNVYLLDRERLPGRLDRRPPCSTEAAGDGSLLPPDRQPQFGTRGPLNVFGPYSEKDAALDLARARSVPAFHRDARGVEHLFVTGSTKTREGSDVGVPPSLVDLEVVRPKGRPPYLRIVRAERSLSLGNPGSPVVTSQGPRDAIVWVLDENASRSASLAGPGAPRPVLYAFDARTLDVLWKSDPGVLHSSGKYNEPSFGGGQVFVGTDRIQAFGAGRDERIHPTLPAADAGPPASVPLIEPRAPQAPDAIYRARCAACHDHPEGNIPPRAVLASRSKARIVDALSRGVMRPFAEGLQPVEIERLAESLQ